MIKFDFTVSDADAENIFDAISSKIVSCMILQQKILANKTMTPFEKDAEIKILDNEIDYYQELKKKMTNYSVSGD